MKHFSFVYTYLTEFADSVNVFSFGDSGYFFINFLKTSFSKFLSQAPFQVSADLLFLFDYCSWLCCMWYKGLLLGFLFYL